MASVLLLQTRFFSTWAVLDLSGEQTYKAVSVLASVSVAP